MQGGLTVRTSIAFKVVSVYLVIVAASLVLAGALTNRTIHGYVIGTTKQSLVAYGRQIISNYELFGRLVQTQPRQTAGKSPQNVFTVSVAAQNVHAEYAVIDSAGRVLGGTFTHAESGVLTEIGPVIARALNGKISVGVYPASAPQYEIVALPFHYLSGVPMQLPHISLPSDLNVRSSPYFVRLNTRVLTMFTNLSDLQRITSQIWWSVAQGLVISSIIIALVGIVLARRMMRPVWVLKEAVNRVRQRDFSAVTPMRTGDEWEELSKAFADMVASLRSFDEAQKRFLQNASHELKTPLMAIRGYAEGLRDGVFESSETFRVLDIVAQESVRLKHLVDELIYLSKLETLDEVYNFEQCDISSIIYKTIERVLPLAQDRNILVTPLTPDGALFCLADSDKLSQVLLNLLSNAVRHARRKVQIAARVAAQGGVEIIVEDDGKGIAPDELNRVFERFYHGAQGDTGLGMSIAKAIVEKHRGTIVVKNGERGGARFVVTLPE